MGPTAWASALVQRTRNAPEAWSANWTRDRPMFEAVVRDQLRPELARTGRESERGWLWLAATPRWEEDAAGRPGDDPPGDEIPPPSRNFFSFPEATRIATVANEGLSPAP